MQGLYFLHEQNRCGEISDSIIVTYQPLPVSIDLGSDTVLCPGESLLLTGPSTLDEFNWQDGSSGQSLLADHDGIYILSITNSCGLSNDTIEVNYDHRAPILPGEDEFKLCTGDSVELDASQSFPAMYLWSTLSDAPSIVVTNAGLYSVSILTECNSSTFEFHVLPETDCVSTHDIYIPNIFSPNDDHINDEFGIYPDVALEIISLKASIFDRWGNLVYSSEAMPFTWDGKFENDLMMPGVYVYHFSIQYKVNRKVVEEKRTGDVTLVR